MADESVSDELNELVLQELECPICFEYCKSPIVQCSNGHIFCAKCRFLTALCALCSAPIENTRNIFAEKIINQVKFPCRFGCEIRVEQRNMTAHENTCKFVIRCQFQEKAAKKPYHAPCPWTGSLFELEGHLGSAHHSNTTATSGKMTHHFELKRGIDFQHLLVERRHFWSGLVYDFQTHTMQCMVFCIGSKEEAGRFVFQYDVTMNAESESILREGNVRSYFEDSTLAKYFLVDKSTMIGAECSVLCKGRDVMKLASKDGAFSCIVSVELKRSDGTNRQELTAT